MFHHDIPTGDPRGALPRCLDCGRHDRHDDTCPARQDLLDLLDADRAALAARPGRPHVRPLHRVECATLAATGVSAPRQERHRWAVHVAAVADGVRRIIYRDGEQVAELDDVAVGAR